jgi:hypothetical protein
LKQKKSAARTGRAFFMAADSGVARRVDQQGANPRDEVVERKRLLENVSSEAISHWARR